MIKTWKQLTLAEKDTAAAQIFAESVRFIAEGNSGFFDLEIREKIAAIHAKEFRGNTHIMRQKQILKDNDLVEHLWGLAYAQCTDYLYIKAPSKRIIMV